MLNKVSLTRADFGHIEEKLADNIQLVIPRINLPVLLFARALVLFFHDLSVVFDDIRKACAGEGFPPEVIRLEAVRIRRIARAVVITFIERQKPGVLAGKLSAEAHL